MHRQTRRIRDGVDVVQTRLHGVLKFDRRHLCRRDDDQGHIVTVASGCGARTVAALLPVFRSQPGFAPCLFRRVGGQRPAVPDRNDPRFLQDLHGGLGIPLDHFHRPPGGRDQPQTCLLADLRQGGFHNMLCLGNSLAGRSGRLRLGFGQQTGGCQLGLDQDIGRGDAAVCLDAGTGDGFEADDGGNARFHHAVKPGLRGLGGGGPILVNQGVNFLKAGIRPMVTGHEEASSSKPRTGAALCADAHPCHAAAPG